MDGVAVGEGDPRRLQQHCQPEGTNAENGQKQEKGLDILCKMADNEVEYATWYLSLPDRQFLPNATSCRDNIDTMLRLVRYMEQADNKDTMELYTNKLEMIFNAYNDRLKSYE